MSENKRNTKILIIQEKLANHALNDMLKINGIYPSNAVNHIWRNHKKTFIFLEKSFRNIIWRQYDTYDKTELGTSHFFTIFWSFFVF